MPMKRILRSSILIPVLTITIIILVVCDPEVSKIANLLLLSFSCSCFLDVIILLLTLCCPLDIELIDLTTNFTE